MKLSPYIFFALSLSLFFANCEKDPALQEGEFLLEALYFGNQKMDLGIQPFSDIPIDLPIELIFSVAIDPGSAANAVKLQAGGTDVEIQLQYVGVNKNIKLTPKGGLSHNTSYTLTISSELKSQKGQSFSPQQFLFQTINGSIRIMSLTIDGQPSNPFDHLLGISLQPAIEVVFSSAVEPSSLQNNVLLSGGASGSPAFDFLEDQTKVQITFDAPLEDWTKYTLIISDDVNGVNGGQLEEVTQAFYTKVDETPKFPALSDEELMTLIQQQTFKYFWDFAHPVSGLSRERSASTETVTSGGSGFGLMTIIVGIERGFISREEGIERLEKIVSFLANADRFHGVWSHWLNGSTGKALPFSAKDNGGDLVETSFLAMGLLTIRQYLNEADAEEKKLIVQINDLWETIEWNWHTQGGQNVLYWHWSPDFNFEKNHKISGYNEALITYIMAAASPTFSIEPEVYHEGWARNGGMQNGKTFYDIELPLGNRDFGGPLFFEHYTYLGIDPRNLKDKYADYWQQALNHSLINRAYCIDNPKNFVGYSSDCWGLTASDGNAGYSAHSPTNDRGVITPTAALSSFPYTPEYSMDALHHFYYTLGDRLWGEYGFYDAFNPTAGWVASSFLAIDQGPIILMIENHRTGLLWELFMSCPEVQAGLTKLGFTY